VALSSSATPPNAKNKKEQQPPSSQHPTIDSCAAAQLPVPVTTSLSCQLPDQ
jgi:hypothetical protein